MSEVVSLVLTRGGGKEILYVAKAFVQHYQAVHQQTTDSCQARLLTKSETAIRALHTIQKRRLLKLV